MKVAYRHLTDEERIEIHSGRQAGLSMREIARKLNRHTSTISRELKRNTGKRGYRAKQAHQKALSRRALPRYRKVMPLHWAFIKSKLKEKYSPEQISGRMKRLSLGYLSHETIYQLILADKQRGGDLYLNLRIANGKKRRKRYGRKDARGRIPGRIGIEHRPKVIEDRKRVGDWEADLISGAFHKGFLVTLVERKARLVVIGYVHQKKHELVNAEICRILKARKLPVKSITFDNGKEFAGHQTIAEKLGCKTYFANPYHSWERGSNENMNGLIRQYLPKGTDLRMVQQSQLEAIENELNHRPRKLHQFKTPLEVLKMAN